MPFTPAEKRQWRKTHPEQTKAANAQYRQAKPEVIKAFNALKSAWRKANPKEARQRDAYYRKKNMPNILAKNARQRAQKRNAPINDFTAQQWREMQSHYGHRCVYCGKRCKGHLTQDHITPFAKGGAHTKSNIVPACRSCNSRKMAGPAPKPIQPLLL